MKVKKIMLAGLIVIAMNCSLIACGREEKGALQESSEPRTENTEPAEETDSTEEISLEDSSSETETENNEESSEAPTEFAIPIQEDFTPVEGLSDKYVDFENRSFAYNGKVFKLGESTLKDLIDGGIPFNESDLNNKGNNINSNYESSRYTVEINDHVSMQFKFVNITDDTLTEEECLLSYVRFYYHFVPQPDYDAEMNARITENILDAANTVCFSFPATLTKEQLLENSSEGAEQDEYNNVVYNIDSEIYLLGSSYHFKFNKTTNQLTDMSMDWLP
ncbi:MAG: hypothetical protein HDQ96_07265 [Lachnospiraceae bacterium]|nr:hypothetical protein [Lachnospiraceae bacterium]